MLEQSATKLSANIIVHFRLHRSTKTPAKGPNTTWGKSAAIVANESTSFPPLQENNKNQSNFSQSFVYYLVIMVFALFIYRNANYIFMDDDEKEKFANTFNLRCIASYRMQE